MKDMRQCDSRKRPSYCYGSLLKRMEYFFSIFGLMMLYSIINGLVFAHERTDFNKGINPSPHFLQTGLNDKDSLVQSLSNQLERDLKKAEAILACLKQIKSQIEADSSQINSELNRKLQQAVAKKMGKAAHAEWFEDPRYLESRNKRQRVGDDFIFKRRDKLIAKWCTREQRVQVKSFFYQQRRAAIEDSFEALKKSVHETIFAPFDTTNMDQAHQLFKEAKQDMDRLLKTMRQQIEQGHQDIVTQQNALKGEVLEEVKTGKKRAQKNVILPDNFAKNWGLHSRGE